jgi:POT family proton-dependent oligopeptide transporter
MLRRHPAGLYILFLTEMWERFGFYCMSAIFLLYMKDKENGHPFLQANAAQILGFYLGFVYFAPFFGGILADQWLGYRASIYIGGVLLAAGYFLLGVDDLTAFFGGIALVVLGNGLFKPNISTLVGKLYPAGDPRLDSAYTIFYMGINIGAFISPLTATVVVNYFRRGTFDAYHVAFSAAGFGMLISVLTFWLLRRWVVAEDRPTASALATDAEKVPPAVQRHRHYALLIIFAVVILFWMAFKQNAGTFNLWFKDHTFRTPQPWLREAIESVGMERYLLDSEGMLGKTLQSMINPFFVIAFSPLMVWFWTRLRHRGLEPSTPGKVALGMLLTAAAFSLMTTGGLNGGDEGRVSGAYLVGAYAILTLGELCLSPMGLSLVSKLAARRQRSMWMGGWFAATAIGGYLSGAIGGLWDEWRHSTFFAFLAVSSIVAFAVMMSFYRYTNRAMPTKKPLAASQQPAKTQAASSAISLPRT